MSEDCPQIFLSKIKHLLTDSRNLTDAMSTMFFCLEGNGRSGCDYIEELYEKGVRRFVVPKNYQSDLDAKFIHCINPLAFLQALSHHHRETFNGQVIAITGSNGKTVVKEWLSQLLNKNHYTYRSPKSYNSQIGVPLSLWGIPTNADYAIIEAGISEVGEMDRLANIIEPEIGIFTTLGNAHQENFESLEQKAIEKLRLFKNSKTIIYRKDNEMIDKLIQSSYDDKELISWSMKDKYSQYYVQYSNYNKKIRLYANGNLLHSFPFPHSDKASIENIGQCLVTAMHLGFEPEEIDISKTESVAMRLEHKKGINGCNLINDAYNNDINSLSIALDALNKLSDSHKGQKTLFLSDIEQSGIETKALYYQLSDLLALKGIDRLIGIGDVIYKNRNHFSLKQKEFYPSTAKFLEQFDPLAFHGESILFKGARRYEFEKITRLLEDRRHQTTLEIDLNALRDNYNYFRGLLKPETKIMGMVKAFAYGSGALEVARALQQQGCDYLSVAVADEGIDLREGNITLPIIVLTPQRNSFEAMIENKLEPAIYSFSELKSFFSVANNLNMKHYPVHLKFDTGMHRLGFCTNDISELVDFFAQQEILEPLSVYSHLAAADEEQWDDFTKKQIEKFEDIAKQIEEGLGKPIFKHILNSSGIERFTASQNDMVRLGIGMYGISAIGQNMQQLTTLKTSITQIKHLTAKDTVGYGRHGTVEKDSTIATLPIGYADGLRRCLGKGKGHVVINGQQAPFIGNICMDLSMVDITGIDAREGDEVIIMGNELPVTVLAELMETIPYEVLTSISQRVKRIYVE